MNDVPNVYCASFKRRTWAEFKSLSPELQAIKDRLIAIGDERAKKKGLRLESQKSCDKESQP